MLGSIFVIQLGTFSAIVAISIALLGLSASGLHIYLSKIVERPDVFQEHYYTRILWYVVAAVICPVILVNLPIHYGDFIMAGNSSAILFKNLIYLLAAIPFYAGGVCVFYAFSANPGQISTLYFFDLAGAAIGCVLAPILLSMVGAPKTILFSIVPVILAVLFAPTAQVIRRRAFWLALPVILAILVLGNHTSLLTPKKLNSYSAVVNPQQKICSIRKGDLEYEEWALDAWTIIRAKKIPQQWENFVGWGLSTNFNGFIPEIRLINFNSRYSTYVSKFDGDFSRISEWLDADLISLHYLLGRPYQSVLNVGAGGGREVLNALHHNAKRVLAVDISRVTVNSLMKVRLREFSGNLYFDPRVEAVVDEGKSYVARLNEKFDLIDFSIVGGAASEKIDLINTDTLFTQEALNSYFNHLNSNGVFSYGMYGHRVDLIDGIVKSGKMAFLPYIPHLKTLAGIRRTLEGSDSSIRFSDHVLIASLSHVIDPDYDLVHIIVSKEPWSQSEVDLFIRKTEQLGFNRLYPADGSRHNIYSDLVTADSLRSFAETLPFNIMPATDNSPFYFALNISGADDFRRYAMAIVGILNSPLVLGGFAFAVITLVFLFGPLLLSGSQRLIVSSIPKSVRKLAYFACLGLAYMFVEMAAIYRIQAYLGRPIYSLSVALFSFLLASGIGSASTHIFVAKKSRIILIVGFICLLVLAFHYVGRDLMGRTLAAPVWGRLAIAAMIIFPMAVPMGMLFPLGIKSLYGDETRIISWVCAVNGAASVFALFAVRITALLFDMSTALLVGGLCYVAAAFLFKPNRHPLSDPNLGHSAA
ncbi:MAG: hypothetical protein KKC51_11370 [Verrucomicrobia bacterium]|nr:hypothetical protein [Verrucomicrobiota bacterium]